MTKIARGCLHPTGIFCTIGAMKNLSNYVKKDYKKSYGDHASDQLLGIFGNPIGHTLSPVIHDTVSDTFSLDERYIPFQIPEEELKSAVEKAYEEGILGLNITVPHKQAVMDSLCEIDPDAAAIGAVNTLVRTDKGYKGYNTDMPGLYAAIRADGHDVKGKSVVLIGAGGAARAACYMCVKYGAKKIIILNRTLENASSLAEDMKKTEAYDPKKTEIRCYAAGDYQKIPKGHYLMIQCTSVGLKKKDGLPLVSDDAFYRMADYGVDLIYNPAETPFLKKLNELSVPHMNGLSMLLFQGVLANQLWNGKKIEKDLSDKIYRKLCDTLYGKDNIILIGYMGSGKSTVAKKIASQYGYTLVDTDKCIKTREGMAIPDIFSELGEEYFRDAETALLRELAEDLHHAVLSTGGGMPLRKENIKLLKKIGKIFYLSATPERIYERVKGDKERPLLQGADPYRKICEMILYRHPIYESAADGELDTGNTKPAELAKIIVSEMQP